MRVAVIGGGYAGMACLIELRKHLPEAELHLIDQSNFHLKLTLLHETLRRPLDEVRKPFAALGKAFGFEFHNENVDFEPDTVKQWQVSKVLSLNSGKLAFDYLVIATGASPHRLPSSGKVLGLNDFRAREGHDVLDGFLTESCPKKRRVSVVGAGATGIQFLFEINELIRHSGANCELQLVDSDESLFNHLPGSFHTYLKGKMEKAGITYLPRARFIEQIGNRILMSDSATGEKYEAKSELTLLFPGLASQPFQLTTNRFGQVVIDGETLAETFAAGDCAYWDSIGLNALTAQAAVRKGKQVATNIRRKNQGRWMLAYYYDELGYFVSLGPLDGIGWMLTKNNVIRGFPAFAIKEAIELQYDLLVNGVDTYTNLWPIG